MEDTCFFAIDDVDLAEDTADGKRTLHGTAMVIYQRSFIGNDIPKIELPLRSGKRSIKQLPSTQADLLDCPKPQPQPACPVYTSFLVQDEVQEAKRIPDIAWLVAKSLAKCKMIVNEDSMETSAPNSDKSTTASKTHIPTWNAYHSLVGKALPVT